MLKVLGTLTGSQARWYVARETVARGRGGLKAMYELTGLGHSVSDETVRRRLADMGYSLQANVKNLAESAAGRDQQFRYINRRVKQFLAGQEPVLSVDTKKKERVGNFKNGGQTL